MKRLKIMKAYAVLWLFIYFLVYSNLDAMSTFFFATLTFNLAVLTVLIIGIIVIIRASIKLVMLSGTFGILAYKKDNLAFYLQGIEKIMPANIAHMFNSRAEKGVLLFTAEESRSVIEWIDEKFSHQNRYVNYFISTSLMIGLLGTFTGLLVSIDQMGTIILSLSGDIDLGEVIASFAGPLGGMAIGFGSSLFGVISAIILGLMGYILNKNQETLVEGVEDWLKGRIIESAAPTGGIVAMTGNDEALPESRSSFLDVFIDNISSLTKEMAKISVTNERLHSITIASVQQARDEHEVSYDLFSAMNENLTNINSSAKDNSLAINTRLENIENAIVNSEQDTNSHMVEELQNLATILSKNEELETQNLSNVLQSVSSIEEKLASKMSLLQSLEKLQKIQIMDARKQSRISSSEQNESKELLEKQREILELLVGKNEANINDLRRLSDDSVPSRKKSFFSKIFG